MRTVAVDFDGVVHAYRRGWADGTIYDEPVEGAFDALRALMKDAAVFVHTTRDAQQVAEWLTRRGWFTCVTEPDRVTGPFWDVRGVLLVTGFKYPAVAYIDDRAIRFTGWPQALADLAAHTSGTAPAPTPLEEHGRRELALIGEEPEVIDWYCRVVRAFESYGHSGGSASVAVPVLCKLLSGDALAALTCDPAEWQDRSGESGAPMWQNIRDGRAFSEDAGKTYWYVHEPPGADGKPRLHGSAPAGAAR